MRKSFAFVDGVAVQSEVPQLQEKPLAVIAVKGAVRDATQHPFSSMQLYSQYQPSKSNFFLSGHLATIYSCEVANRKSVLVAKILLSVFNRKIFPWKNAIKETKRIIKELFEP